VIRDIDVRVAGSRPLGVTKRENYFTKVLYVNYFR